MVLKYEIVAEYEDAQGGIDGETVGEIEYEIGYEELEDAVTECIMKEYNLKCDKGRLEQLLQDLDIDFEEIAEEWYEEQIKDMFRDDAYDQSEF